MKPDPSVAFEAIEGMGIQPAECAYFGDSGVDMQTAEAAGARGVGVLGDTVPPMGARKRRARTD